MIIHFTITILKPHFIFSSEEEIDVDGSVRVPTPPYDSNKASLMMNECERHVTFANPNLNEDISEWEEKVTK